MRRARLIALKGHPGAGKSALGRALSRRLAIPLIDKDDIKDVLPPGCPDAGGLAYAAMFRIARRQLLHGLSVICDSPLSERAGYDSAAGIAAAAAAELVVIECVCSSPEEWRRRIEARAAHGPPPHRIASWAALEAHLRRRGDAARYPIAAPHLRLDTLAPLERLLEQVVAWLGE